ncbi:hypothetical protein L202_08159 [Cryptococcus amylolentus CBS 6039]|uniref:Uncharacterized protein n=1 Tax=Cryptococcus amylolentus CBS 6039 TaxID=1295533 RepID=A0A1E3HB94_9TREE|nr:hypothetical protein L202_08159 [Cryptococcus amylolentus CBS 6039]ODN72721.1 hypothetical protein L202_08159 [Cryptococcus amylolentus CBS 6039]
MSVPLDEIDSATCFLRRYLDYQRVAIFEELHIYLRDDITFVNDPLSLDPSYTSFGAANLESLRMQMMCNILPEFWRKKLAGFLEQCGYWSWDKGVHLYGLHETLARYESATSVGGRFRSSEEDAFITTPIQNGARGRKTTQGADATSLPAQTTPITFHSATEHYDKNWTGMWAPGEERYYAYIVKPGEEMKVLREEAAEETGHPVETFLTLSCAELQQVVELWKNPPVREREFCCQSKGKTYCGKR